MFDPFTNFKISLGNFFGGFLQLTVVRNLAKNPLMLFVYGIISKWYITIVVTAVVVTFYVFKGLEEKGVIKNIETILFQSVNEIKSVSKNCVPKILNFTELWDCLQNPPAYEPNEQEKALQKSLEDSLNNQNKTPAKDDPYSN